MPINAQDGNGAAGLFARSQGTRSDGSPYPLLADYPHGQLTTPGASVVIPVRWNATAQLSSPSDGSEAYPSLGPEWQTGETWAITYHSSDQNHQDFPPIATQDAPNGWTVTRSGEGPFERTVVRAGTTYQTQDDQIGSLTISVPESAGPGRYTVDYTLSYGREVAPFTRFDLANTYTRSGTGTTIIGNRNFLIRYPDMRLVPPPGAPNGTPADVIHIPFIPSAQQYATLYLQMDTEAATAQTYGPAITCQFQGGPTVFAGAEPYLTSPPPAHYAPFDPSNPSATITDVNTNWPNDEIETFLVESTGAGGIYGINVPLTASRTPTIYTLSVYSAAHFDPFPIPADQYGIENISFSSLSADSRVPNLVFTDQDTYSGITGDFFGTLIIYLDAPRSGGDDNHPATSASLNLDAHRRPLAVAADPVHGILAYASKDAGRSFSGTVIDSAGTDPSLLVDRRMNRFRIVYAKTISSVSALYQATGGITDTYMPEAGSPSAITGFSGEAFPVCAQHGTDKDYVLMVYASSSTLMSAASYDAGAKWSTLGTITAADLSSTGRPALCWLGELAILAYASGNTLTSLVSRDRGRVWDTATEVASSGSYTGLSLLGWQGVLYLLAFTGGPSPVPNLFVSRDLGESWSGFDSALPEVSPPSGLGIIPLSGQMRLGITHNSSDDGAHWVSD